MHSTYSYTWIWLCVRSTHINRHFCCLLCYYHYPCIAVLLSTAISPLPLWQPVLSEGCSFTKLDHSNPALSYRSQFSLSQVHIFKKRTWKGMCAPVCAHTCTFVCLFRDVYPWMAWWEYTILHLTMTHCTLCLQGLILS